MCLGVVFCFPFSCRFCRCVHFCCQSFRILAPLAVVDFCMFQCWDVWFRRCVILIFCSHLSIVGCGSSVYIFPCLGFLVFWRHCVSFVSLMRLNVNVSSFVYLRVYYFLCVVHMLELVLLMHSIVVF